MSMRRRQQDDSSVAPMAIIVDTCSSAFFSAEDLMKRGMIILALVRALSARRPVELWAGPVVDSNTSKNHNRGSKNWAAIMSRIDGAPLDLARACYMLTSAGAPRRVGYSIGESDYNMYGTWSFDSNAISTKYMKDLFAPAFPHVVDMLCIPPIYSGDPITKDPEKWMERSLSQFAPHMTGHEHDA
jgi:hypothetical protein